MSSFEGVAAADHAAATSPRKGLSEILRQNPLYEQAHKVFLWEDPIRSGLIFGSFNLFYFLLTFGDYTVLTLVSYLHLTLLLVCFGYVNYVVLKASWVAGKKVENPFVERFKDTTFHVTREDLHKHVDTVLDIINNGIDTLREVFYCTNNLLTLKWALYFYLLATVGNWLSAITWIYLIGVVHFIWPRLYKEKKTEIDQVYGTVVQQIHQYVALAWSKLPPAAQERLAVFKPHSA